MRIPRPNYVYMKELTTSDKSGSPLLTDIEVNPLMRKPLESLASEGIRTADDLVDAAAAGGPDWYAPFEGIGQRRAEILLAKCRQRCTNPQTSDPMKVFNDFWSEANRLCGFMRCAFVSAAVEHGAVVVKFFMPPTSARKLIKRFGVIPLRKVIEREREQQQQPDQ